MSRNKEKRGLSAEEHAANLPTAPLIIHDSVEAAKLTALGLTVTYVPMTAEIQAEHDRLDALFASEFQGTSSDTMADDSATLPVPPLIVFNRDKESELKERGLNPVFVEMTPQIQAQIDRLDKLAASSGPYPDPDEASEDSSSLPSIFESMQRSQLGAPLEPKDTES